MEGAGGESGLWDSFGHRHRNPSIGELHILRVLPRARLTPTSEAEIARLMCVQPPLQLCLDIGPAKERHYPKTLAWGLGH